MFESIFELDLPDKTKEYYQDKYDTKEKWSYCYKKSLPCLKVNTTSRIEGLNALIKESLNLSKGIGEIFHKVLKMHLSILNKPYTSENKLSQQVLTDLSKMATLNQLDNILSVRAYQECAISFSQSWNLEVHDHRRSYIFKDKLNEDYEFSLIKSSGSTKILFCTCAYFVTLGLPCSHLFALSRSFAEKVDLKKCIRERCSKKIVSSFLKIHNLLKQ